MFDFTCLAGDSRDQKLAMRMRVHEITLQIRNVLLSKNVPNLERILLIDVIMVILKIERGKPCFIVAIMLQIRNVLLRVVHPTLRSATLCSILNHRHYCQLTTNMGNDEPCIFPNEGGTLVF